MQIKKEITIPKHSAQLWYKKYRTHPIVVEINNSFVTISGTTTRYLLHEINKEFILSKKDDLGTFILGKFDKHGVYEFISTAAKNDLSVVRAAVFDISSSAPIGYVMKNGDLVHPGDCFQKHESAFIKRTLYSANEEQMCEVCGKYFL